MAELLLNSAPRYDIVATVFSSCCSVLKYLTLVSPTIFTLVQILLIIKLDAVLVTNSIHCDVYSPLW